MDVLTISLGSEEEDQRPGPALPARARQENNSHLAPTYEGRPVPSADDSFEEVEEDILTISWSDSTSSKEAHL